jgi:L-iditol 2-dehydrogenase
MKQAVMTKPGKIEINEVPIPKIGADQVLIKIKRIGVCGSDIHVYYGLHPYTSYPVIQGHEVSGVISKVGENVENFQPGNLVTIIPQVVCGKCYPCRTGQYHICDNLKVMGFQTDGAAQEYFAVDANNVISIPKEINMDHAAFIEPISVGVHAIQKAGNIKGKGILVLGAGTIGNLLAQAARAMGAEKVLITDIKPYKLEKARQCGLENVINTSKEDLAEKIQQVFGPDKMDYIFECVGTQQTITQAIDNARKGSAIIVVGVFSKDPKVNLGFVQDRELRLLGTLMYQRKDYELAISIIASGKINLEPLITHRFAFDDYLDAYKMIDQSNGEYMKVMIEL